MLSEGQRPRGAHVFVGMLREQQQQQIQTELEVIRYGATAETTASLLKGQQAMRNLHSVISVLDLHGKLGLQAGGKNKAQKLMSQKGT